MTDASLATDAVAGQSLARSACRGLLSSSDKYAGLAEHGVAGLGREAAIQCDLAGFEPKARQLGGGRGQQLALIRRADFGWGWEQQATGTAPCVRGDLGQLEDIAELVSLAELALADRAGLRVGHRDNAFCDLLARQTLGDLPGDGRGQFGGLLELQGRGELALRATTPRGRSGLGGQLARLTDRARNQLTGLPSQLEDLLTRTARLSQPSPD